MLENTIHSGIQSFLYLLVLNHSTGLHGKESFCHLQFHPLR